MTETPHIFDEFIDSNGESTKEEIHRKRVSLEPLVFGILKRKYGDLFRNAFQSYKRPEKSDKCVLIIERRIHENLEFILHNVAYYANGWNIAILCSDINIRYIRAILGDRRPEITVLQVFSGSPDRDTARSEYNSLLKSAEFYESLPTKWNHLLTVQMDSYLRRVIPDSITQYDFIASISSWDTTNMSGGMTYRRRQTMIDVCNRYTPVNKEALDEDDYIFKGTQHLGYSIPSYDIAKNLIVESHFPLENIDFFGLHQWWTFCEPDVNLIQYFSVFFDCKEHN
jgi:hypothetical protein